MNDPGSGNLASSPKRLEDGLCLGELQERLLHHGFRSLLVAIDPPSIIEGPAARVESPIGLQQIELLEKVELGFISRA